MPYQTQGSSNHSRVAYRNKIANRRLSDKPKENEEKGIHGVINVAGKFIGLITWQVLLIVALFLFYTPIKRVIDVMPEKFEKSNEISVGSLSLKIQEQAKASGNAELAGIIQGLSQKALQRLLYLGRGNGIGLVSTVGSDEDAERTYEMSDIEEVRELYSKGLIQSEQDLIEFEKWFNSLLEPDGKVRVSSLNKEQRNKMLFMIRLSDKGKRAYDIIINVIAESIANK